MAKPTLVLSRRDWEAGTGKTRLIYEALTCPSPTAENKAAPCPLHVFFLEESPRIADLGDGSGSGEWERN